MMHYIGKEVRIPDKQVSTESSMAPSNQQESVKTTLNLTSRSNWVSAGLIANSRAID